MAKSLTEVGFFLASIGPPIIVMLLGGISPRAAISAIPASTGTVGWHTETTCTFA